MSPKQDKTRIISKNPRMLEIFETVEKISNYKTTVMITGESGTGKELIAKSIHENSDRADKKFIAINCGAIPENLLESELFGHKKGSFTDATKDKTGLFEEADGGTILLDEIGELPFLLQVKLLRVLQENEILPIGETKPKKIDVRIIAATLRDLDREVEEEKFRDDLYYRLNVINITIPPLRYRKDDVPILTEHFIEKNKVNLNLGQCKIEDGALKALINYDWPGNIRELENCIERAMILSDEEGVINKESLPQNITLDTKEEESPEKILDDEDLSIKKHTKRLESYLIKKALERTNNNRTHAAKILEISHRALLYKLKEYGI